VGDARDGAANFGDKWAGIADFDLRYRHREADLLANPMSRHDAGSCRMT